MKEEELKKLKEALESMSRSKSSKQEPLTESMPAQSEQSPMQKNLLEEQLPEENSSLELNNLRQIVQELIEKVDSLADESHDKKEILLSEFVTIRRLTGNSEEFVEKFMLALQNSKETLLSQRGRVHAEDILQEYVKLTALLYAPLSIWVEQIKGINDKLIVLEQMIK